VVNIQGNDTSFKILDVLEFSSARRRMSVIVCFPSGKIELFCKGADFIIFEKLASDNDPQLLKDTQQHVNYYSSKGLRTLCFASRALKPGEYEHWKQIYTQATLAIADRASKVEQAAEMIEKNLYLQGVSAIEDKLQAGVPETLADLLRAEIKVWVLTGDKQETAISIGRSANLIQGDSQLLKLNCTSSEQFRLLMSSFLNEVQSNDLSNGHFILVVDGKSLSYALSETQEDLLQLVLYCSCVICCRVSPIQKAQVVKLVKYNVERTVTLSVGDGANDVSMIQEADIGIGIQGREGSQASRSADFSISRFHMLRRLLFVHGRYAYLRVAHLIQYSFYKNLAITSLQFYFAFYNGFSGQTLLESWVISVFNLFFTSIPVVVFAIFERDISDKYLEQFPELYRRSKNNTDFNPVTFTLWLLDAVWHSLVFFFGALFLWNQVLGQSGHVFGLWSFGTISCTACVITVTFRLALCTNYWPWITFVCSILSIGTYFLFLIVYGYITFLPQVDMFMLFLQLGNTWTFWLITLCLVVIATIPDFTAKWIKQNDFPDEWQTLKVKLHREKQIRASETLSLLPKQVTKSYGST